MRTSFELEEGSLGPLVALPLACLLVDPEGHIRAANAAATELLGMDGRLVTGKPLASFMAPGSRRALGRLLRERPEGSELAVDLVGRAKTPVPVRLFAARDGHRLLLVLVDQGPEVDEQTRVTALERRRDSEAARRQRRDVDDGDSSWVRVRLGRLLEALPQGVLSVDQRLRVTDVNRAAGVLLGEAGGRGKHLPSDWHGFDLAAFARSLFKEQVMSAEAAVSVPERRDVLLLGMASEDRRHAAIIFADVSEQSRREQAERNFLTNAAHELQSPIAAVASAVEALELGAKDEPDELERFLRHLRRESNRMQTIVRALLELARAQHRGEAPRFERVELRPFLEATAERLQPTDGVEVDVVCPTGLTVESSRELLAHAVGNAAANAARFTRDGRIRLSALARGDRIVIEVADSGPGIAEHERGRVVERFYRSHPSGADSGSGLGLAIADQALTAIGGLLTLDHAPEGGTLVRIAVPRDVAP